MGYLLNPREKRCEGGSFYGGVEYGYQNTPYCGGIYIWGYMGGLLAHLATIGKIMPLAIVVLGI